MSDTPAVRLSDVSKSFGTHPAVKALSLEVPRATVYGFLGPNGSGKTTTLRLILHILLPDSGTVSVLGASGTRAANDRIGYLPEERGLYKKMEVRRQLEYLSALKGVPPARSRPMITAWLERFGLAEWADEKVETLSKGMCQKVQFIAAVACQPELVVLDEPFSGLDPVNQEVLRDAILELKRRGTTVILSTHDMTAAEEMCDFVCMMNRGGKVLDGTLDELRRTRGDGTVRVETAGGAAALAGLPGVASVRDLGRLQEVRVDGDPQELLKALLARGAVTRFETVRPTLKEIFLAHAAAPMTSEAALPRDSARAGAP
ncbi:MAG: ATP-binding cassette domain-containing protein [Elusimicrobia bacterium]|nr:ATP-binding cassette domain-containing protein [Elusimicrobiota bacterium]